MDGDVPERDQIPTIRAADIPNTFGRGQTLLVACPGNPTEYAFGLQALAHHAGDGDTAVVVTTNTSASETIAAFDHFAADGPALDLKVVDTASHVQSLSAIYDEVPIIFTPAPGDLERLTVALSDLTDAASAPDTERHLVVRSLTPILETTPTGRVCTVLDRITGLRTSGGTCSLGIDYTAHDEATLNNVAALTDGVLWLSQPTPDGIDVEFRPSIGRHTRA